MAISHKEMSLHDSCPKRSLLAMICRALSLIRSGAKAALIKIQVSRTITIRLPAFFHW